MVLHLRLPENRQIGLGAVHRRHPLGIREAQTPELK